jgi:hypothetical protein
MNDTELGERLRVFADAGLIPAVPTWWQIRQGELEMTPYVISTDATAEEGYAGKPLGHPLLRQPLVVSQVGWDHFRTGSGLDVALESLCAHLQLTYHRGMPVFDLQAVQTHPGGLDRLRACMEDLVEPVTALGRRRRRLAGLILARPEEYAGRFLARGGWIERAARLDYPTPADEGSDFPAEFWSLTGFLGYCTRFPAERAALPWHRLPRHYARLVGRRLREGRRMGWLARRGAAS